MDEEDDGPGTGRAVRDPVTMERDLVDRHRRGLGEVGGEGLEMERRVVARVADQRLRELACIREIAGLIAQLAAVLERGGDVREKAANISSLIDDCIETSR